jgi:pimeloyl-ACP methyl ester carboxylesterase
MSQIPDILWLNASPSLQYFAQPLLRYLCHKGLVREWEYSQKKDEASSLDVALVLLHDYLKSCHKPVHLVGHSIGGLLALLYTRKHPERVRSLTLLSVGVNPAVDWQAHYYAQRQILPCSRLCVLTQMARFLFGKQDDYTTQILVEALKQDLDCSISPHSLFKRVSLPPGGVSVPLLVCGALDDIVVDVNALRGWLPFLKESDRLWQAHQGGHFFHYFYPQLVAENIREFWDSQTASMTHSIMA